MKSSVIMAALLCAVTAFVILASAGAVDQGRKTEAAVQYLPASLDNYYPPKSPAPTYLLAMMNMARPFSGMVSDLMENDAANAQANFEKFKKLYLEVSAMIPEWKQEFAMEPVDNLGAALASGDPGQIMPAAEALGGACHNCHVKTMAPVHYKYRWNKFSDLTLTDPLSGQDVDYATLMLMMETNFTGTGVNLEQGQPDNAVKQFSGFKARFQAITDACSACHDSERKYFVDKNITDKIGALETELNKPEADMAVIGGLFQAIGEESCAKCHLVHVPAANAQQLSGTAAR